MDSDDSPSWHREGLTDQTFPPTWWERDHRIVHAAGPDARAAVPELSDREYDEAIDRLATLGFIDVRDGRVIGATAAAQSLLRLQRVLELLNDAVDREVGREITTAELGAFAALASGIIDPGCYALARQGLAERHSTFVFSLTASGKRAVDTLRRTTT